MNSENRQKDNLIIEKRQASWLIASLLFIGVLLFISGYIIGKKRAVQEFAHQVVNDSFLDQAHHSLYSMYGHTQPQEEEKEGEGEEETVSAALPKDTEGSILGATQMSAAPMPAAIPVEPAKIEPKMHFYSELIGFGSKRTAESFVKRVTSLGIPVILKERVSKNKGRVVTWYQVITPEYDSEQELQRVIAIIKRAEHLKTVLIKKH